MYMNGNELVYKSIAVDIFLVKYLAIYGPGINLNSQCFTNMIVIDSTISFSIIHLYT